ncbi:MAG: dihydrodipicolinate synthase family protein [Clostridia bacterium]|nr:dihydrodipicolinate synthase family protein [Clostridia bacterium]
MDKSKFKGILVPVISPIKPEGGVDLDAMEKVIRYVFSKGVDGLYVCGATGDGSYLRIPDRKAVAERAAKICKEYGKLCIINAGVKSTEESVELVKHAVAAGADAVSAMPVDRSNSIQRRNYYEKLAAAAGDTPFLLYYIPAFTLHIPADELIELLSIKNVIGLKFSDANFFYMRRLLIHKPDLVIFNGEDELLTYGLLAGATGGIGMNYNVFPELFVLIYKCVQSGDIKHATVLQNALAEFLDPVFRYGLYESVEHTVKLRFGIERCFREPNAVHVMTDEQKAEVADKMKYLDGVVAQVAAELGDK